MSSIGIVDADLLDGGTHHPNLVCLKLSGYHKEKGDNVTLISGYADDFSSYDKVYVAKVFTKTNVPAEILTMPNVEIGGTGFFYDKATPLPHDIEHHMPDYHLYDTYVESAMKSSGVHKAKVKRTYLDYSIGFTTRGCIRHCEFCVNKNYDHVSRHSHVKEFLDEGRPFIMLLDDNILAYPKWREVFEEIQATGKKFCFKQGMDLRLMTDEKAKVIASSKYDGDFIFAFDNYADKDIIIPKLRMFRQYTTKIPMFYLFCGFKSQGVDDIATIFERLKLLWANGGIGYCTRHENINGSRYEGLYTQIASWINMPAMQKKLSLWEFAEATQKRVKSKCSTVKHLEAFAKEYPDLAKEWFNMKRERFV